MQYRLFPMFFQRFSNGLFIFYFAVFGVKNAQSGAVCPRVCGVLAGFTGVCGGQRILRNFGFCYVLTECSYICAIIKKRKFYSFCEVFLHCAEGAIFKSHYSGGIYVFTAREGETLLRGGRDLPLRVGRTRILEPDPCESRLSSEPAVLLKISPFSVRSQSFACVV